MSTSTMELKQIFEYELRSKLGLKAKRNTSEVTMLINAFHFYDIFNTNTVNLDQWKKTFGKIGLIGFTDMDMTQLFNFYDRNQKGVINYKDFAYSLYYNTESYPPLNEGDEQRKVNEQYDNQLRPITPIQSNITPMRQQPINQPQIQPIPKSQEPSPFVCNTPLKNEVKRYFQYLLDQVSHQININNGIGYFIFASKLKEAEDKIHRVIQYEAYLKCLNELQINLNPKEALDLFSLLDLADRKCISTWEFLRLLQKPLTERRRNVIFDLFASIDQARRGECRIEELNALFNAKNHPEVSYGRKTEEEVKQEFTFTLNTFLFMKEITKMTIEDFIEYHSIISGSIDNDSYFEILMNSIWSKSKPIGLNSTTSGSSKTPSIRAKELQYTPSQNQIHLNPILNSQYPTQTESHIRYNPINNTYNISESKSKPTPKPGTPYLPPSSNAPIEQYSSHKEQVTQAILKLRNGLISRGAKGIFGLLRLFKLYDKQSTNKIHIANFDSLCQAYRLDLTPEEINAIYSILDTDQSAIIDYTSLIKLLTGEMNQIRANIVIKAFNFLDKARTNSIDQYDLKVLYNASRHPDVVLGKRTQSEVLGEWLDLLDAFCLYNNIPLHQKFSFEDFIKFYSQISMSIDDDRYFDYLLNNVWNLKKDTDFQYQQQPKGQSS